MSKKIIVVDDSRAARQQVADVLMDAGYEIVEAIDGHNGTLKVAANPDAAMVICDVNMPKMSGLDMLAAVKSDVNNAALPFLTLTTEAQPELVQQAKQHGAKGWIIKPFRSDLLLSAVKRLAG